MAILGQACLPAKTAFVNCGYKQVRNHAVPLSENSQHSFPATYDGDSMEPVAFRVSIAFLLAPLMLAAQDTTSLPFTISGYVTTSYTSTARAIGDTIIVGRAYDRRNNTFLMNVANLTLERAAPTDRVAAGFRAEAWVGPQAA